MRYRLLQGPRSAQRLPHIARLALLALTATGLLMATMVANPPHAHAHNDLESSEPADGGTVSTLPATASLVFSEPLGTTGLQVAVTDRTGAPVAGLAASQIADATLTQALPASMTPGVYTLAYRVVSVDGHPVGGTISFTVDAAAAPATSAAAPSATTSPLESPTPSATPTGTSTPTDNTAMPTTLPSQAAADAGPDNGLHWWWLLIAVAVVLGVGLVLTRRRGRVRATGDRNRDDAS